MVTGMHGAEHRAGSCPEVKHRAGREEMKGSVGRQGGELSQGGHGRCQTLVQGPWEVMGLQMGGYDQTGILRDFSDTVWSMGWVGCR